MIFPEGDADPDPTDAPPGASAKPGSGKTPSKKPKLQVVK
jgi:hypothetical protein